MFIVLIYTERVKMTDDEGLNILFDDDLFLFEEEDCMMTPNSNTTEEEFSPAVKAVFKFFLWSVIFFFAVALLLAIN